MFVIFVGIGQDKNGHAISYHNQRSAQSEVLDLGAKLFGGVTVSRTHGAWNNGSAIVTEQGMRIDIVADPEYGEVKVRDFARHVRDAFNQQSVLVVRIPTTHFEL